MNSTPKIRDPYFAAVFIFTFLITLGLALKTTYINFWPTDSWNAYRPAAAQLFDKPFVSHIHEAVGFKLIIRCKETLILGMALFQKILHDTQTEYPAVLVLIVAMWGSSLLMYIVGKNFFNPRMGFVAFLLLATSFWPYMYILQAAHPPMVLLNFLLSVWCLQKAHQRRGWHFLSGLFVGLMFFSSPTSPIYVPYYAAVWIFVNRDLFKRKMWLKMFELLSCVGLGVIIPVLYFTLPNPVDYFQNFVQYVNAPRQANDFVIWRHDLEKYFSYPENFRGAGFIWIWKYMIFIMPIMFSVYLVSLVYLALRALKKPLFWAVMGISLTTPFMVELSQVAQFGRNYFSWFVGIIFCIVFALNDFYFSNQHAESTVCHPETAHPHPEAAHYHSDLVVRHSEPEGRRISSTDEDGEILRYAQDDGRQVQDDGRQVQDDGRQVQDDGRQAPHPEAAHYHSDLVVRHSEPEGRRISSTDEDGEILRCVQDDGRQAPHCGRKKYFLTVILMGLLSAHVVFNVHYFIDDIFPSRMATTNIYNWLIKNNIDHVFVYRDHPLHKNIVQFLVNPKEKKPINLVPIESIAQVKDGFILVEPITGKTLLHSCRLEDYNRDPFLTLLYRSGEFNRYTVAQFKTLSSSSQWAQEVEVCSYRDLILGQITDEDRHKGMAWILDAGKLQREWFPRILNKETLEKFHQ